VQTVDEVLLLALLPGQAPAATDGRTERRVQASVQ